jgi:gamma-glutamyl:cysteine ligase YbdK (ATP-grasp superfamily)
MKYRLFEGYGIELEYMIVDKQSLSVRSLADELLNRVLGSYGSDFENGVITWSNELVTHVIEIKSSKPEHDFVMLEAEFQKNVKQINSILSTWNACLLPTAAHPFMNPATDTKLWTHDNNEVYALYNTIFDCRGHGWSNLQSTHLNLPFSSDEEFEKLHAAIRIVLPLLPALCASSPVLDGKFTGYHDTRLQFYKANQQAIPIITGHVVPEPVFSEAEHTKKILNKIEDAIRPFNTDGILEPVWVNSRGAMSRFDRGSIEIRIMDIQECVTADLAIQAFVIELIKALVEGDFCSLHEQKSWQAEPLAELLQSTTKNSQDAVVSNLDYLLLFGLNSPATARVLLNAIHTKLRSRPALNYWNETIDFLLTEGTLAQRLLKKMSSGASLHEIYHSLATCVAANQVFK